ncbi:MAG TPA: hypothetical protein VKL40_03540 [Candidatus Angelobacter sp.]|nr:hypothetical protein [Candidatus Angelobacter sp.]
MKRLALFGLVITGLLMTGCDTTRPSEPIAGAEGSKATAAPAAQPSPQPDPASNGGSSLAVSTPYDGGGKTVAQNVNPAPFLVGSPAQTAGTGAPPPPNLLTSRADGTMYGAHDQPAASTSWGTPATNWSSPAPAPAAKPPKKK